MELAKKQIPPPPAPNYFTMTTEDILGSMEKPETISSSLMEGISYAELEQSRDEMEQLEFDGLQNLAGFIAFKLRGKEQLGEITSQQSEMRSHQTWTDFLSEGGLMKPYAHLVKAWDVGGAEQSVYRIQREHFEGWSGVHQEYDVIVPTC